MTDSTPRVLVVDDEPKICELLQALLRREGYEVETAFDARAALSKLRGGAFNLVVSDIKMPGMDGFELARRVKDLDEEMPFVVITGYATMETAVRALRQGVDDYVTKPFRIDEIRQVVSRVLAKARLALENRRLVAELEAANAELRRHRRSLRQKVRAANEDLARANTNLRQRIKELEMLNGIGRCTASELDLDRLLERCARLVADELAVERASIILREGDWLTVKACHGEHAAKLRGVKKRLGEGIAGQVALSGEPVLVKDAEHDPRIRPHRDWGYATGSLACVPINYKGKNLGVICATDKRSGEVFTKADLNLLVTIATQVAPAIENARLYRQLEENTMSAVRALVSALEAKAPYLRGHSQRVTQYALELGKAMGLDEEQLLVGKRAGQLHDLGKMGVSDEILNKPGSLTREEYEAVKRHPVLGEKIISPLSFLKDVRPVIRHHHERPDRSGYPDGQGADEMSALTKIIGIADAFDAMTSPRPYRPAKSAAEACREIAALRSRQFDPEAADAFCDYVVPVRLAELRDNEQQRAG